MKEKYEISGTFKKLVEVIQFMDKCLSSDVFLYMACGMVNSNPEEGMALFDKMIAQGKVGCGLRE